MEKNKLNTRSIELAFERKGLNQSSVAKELDVSRETVSKWLNNENYPRPLLLLKLGKLLNLAFDELVIRADAEVEPIVNFRKKPSCKFRIEEHEKVVEKGIQLRRLWNYIPKTSLSIKVNKNDNSLDYISDIVNGFKNIFSVGANIGIEELFEIFRKLNIILIPVYMGKKGNYSEAYNVYDTLNNQTWIFINLDLSILDVKYLLIHELAHYLSREIENKVDDEEFSEKFAQKLLLSELEIKLYYDEIKKLHKNSRCKYLLDTAISKTISPLSIYYSLNDYCIKNSENEIEYTYPKEVFVETERLKKQKGSLAFYVFNTDNPIPSEFISKSNRITIFWELIKGYINDNPETDLFSFLKGILEVNVFDAKSLCVELKVK
jgi:transcriptional regulator with XRE-family HTH domain